MIIVIKNIEEFNAKKAVIIEGAIGVIMEKGYEQFSLNQLLTSIKMSKGSFFHYFKSKQTLIDSVIEVSAEKISETLDMIQQNKAFTPKEKIRQLFLMSSKHKYHYGNRGEVYAQQVYSEVNKEFIEMVTKYYGNHRGF